MDYKQQSRVTVKGDGPGVVVETHNWCQVLIVMLDSNGELVAVTPDDLEVLERDGGRDR